MAIKDNGGLALVDDLEELLNMLKELIQELEEKGRDYSQYSQESEAAMKQCINHICQDLSRTGTEYPELLSRNKS